jgi:cell wall assembly regulator SMI1
VSATSELALKDARRFKFQAKLLCTSRQILCEAAPIYENAIQAELQLLEQTLARYPKPLQEVLLLDLHFYDIHRKDIVGLLKTINRLENSLKAWRRIEKEISVGGRQCKKKRAGT